MIKARACKVVGQKRKLRSHISYSQKCRRVWRNEPSHSQVNSHFESWNLNGFSNFQKAITKPKTHWIEEFFISLESFWNLNITFETRVPIKFRGVELFFKIESSFSKLFFEQLKDKVKTLLLTFVAFCSSIERYGSMLESEILTLHPHSWKLLICQGNYTFINPNLKLHTHGFRQISNLL